MYAHRLLYGIFDLLATKFDWNSLSNYKEDWGKDRNTLNFEKYIWKLAIITKEESVFENLNTS